MRHENQTMQLVALAQGGNRQALDRLATVVRPRLDQYVARVTLGDDQANDIVQETLIVMIRSLASLRNVDRFWPWLYKITANMIRRHYRNEKRHTGVSLSDVGEEAFSGGSGQPDAVAEAVAQEMRESVLACMGRLKESYRMVLAMRCYDRMPYAEIAEAMGQTEFGARRTFCRAKKALAKELSRCGLGRGALVLALVVFGQMTATSKASAAAVSITPALLEAGWAASLVSSVTTPVGVAVAAGGLAAGVSAPVLHSVLTTPGDPEPAVSVAAERSETGQLDRWYVYLPGGQMLFSVIESADGRDGYRQDFLAEQGNFYKTGNTVRLENGRFYDPELKVARLPSDPPELRSFLDQVEGRAGGLETFQPTGKAAFVLAKSDRCEVLRYDVRDEPWYRYCWPADVQVEDRRDPMHRRGWTTFTVQGHWAGRRVSGQGRLPFVAAEVDQHGPVLSLAIGTAWVYQDTPRGAQIRDAQGRIFRRLPPTSLFAGLPRPWSGLHSIDVVRRDAARQGWVFQTERADADHVRITVQAGDLTLIYAVRLADDLIDSIDFLRNGATIGQWTFTYDQQTPRSPRLRVPELSGSARVSQAPGLKWLVEAFELLESTGRESVETDGGTPL